jgi:hypothetical protein
MIPLFVTTPLPVPEAMFRALPLLILTLPPEAIVRLSMVGDTSRLTAPPELMKMLYVLPFTPLLG